MLVTVSTTAATLSQVKDQRLYHTFLVSTLTLRVGVKKREIAREQDSSPIYFHIFAIFEAFSQFCFLSYGRAVREEL